MHRKHQTNSLSSVRSFNGYLFFFSHPQRSRARSLWEELNFSPSVAMLRMSCCQAPAADSAVLRAMRCRESPAWIAPETGSGVQTRPPAKVWRDGDLIILRFVFQTKSLTKSG